MDNLVALGMTFPSGIAVEGAEVDGGMAEVAAAEDLEACDYHVFGGVGATVCYGSQVLYSFVDVVNLYHPLVLSVALMYPSSPVAEIIHAKYCYCK